MLLNSQYSTCMYILHMNKSVQLYHQGLTLGDLSSDQSSFTPSCLSITLGEKQQN